MHTDAYLWCEPLSPAMLRQHALDRCGTFDRRGDVIERNEESVPRVVDLLASVRRKEPSQGIVVPPDYVVPRVVSDRLDQLHRPHDVREHKGLPNPIPA